MAEERITVAGLYHDLVARTSFVTVTWDASPDRRLVLPVPFGCGLDELEAEAVKAVRSLSVELSTAPIKSAS
ncbi:MAG TPA: hypothetical protein VHZ56_04050 [Devosia sp.]|nr:hypothetical protein [Devosia sp.]